MKYTHVFHVMLMAGCAVLTVCKAASAADAPKPELVDVRKIWDQAPHNAFTDLVRHEGT